MMTARAIIERLGLQPHPEGGHYRETFRSPRLVQPADGRRHRSALTAIHYLLADGERSRWHQVRSDEVWHHAGGAPMELLLLNPDLSRHERLVLGSLDAGHEPHAVVRADWWQAARPLGPWALCSCFVAPGFDFADFAFMARAEDQAQLRAAFPALASLL